MRLSFPQSVRNESQFHAQVADLLEDGLGFIVGTRRVPDAFIKRILQCPGEIAIGVDAQPLKRGNDDSLEIAACAGVAELSPRLLLFLNQYRN